MLPPRPPSTAYRFRPTAPPRSGVRPAAAASAAAVEAAHVAAADAAGSRPPWHFGSAGPPPKQRPPPGSDPARTTPPRSEPPATTATSVRSSVPCARATFGGTAAEAPYLAAYIESLASGRSRPRSTAGFVPPAAAAAAAATAATAAEAASREPMRSLLSQGVEGYGMPPSRDPRPRPAAASATVSMPASARGGTPPSRRGWPFTPADPAVYSSTRSVQQPRQECTPVSPGVTTRVPAAVAFTADSSPKVAPFSQPQHPPAGAATSPSKASKPLPMPTTAPPTPTPKPPLSMPTAVPLPTKPPPKPAPSPHRPHSRTSKASVSSSDEELAASALLWLTGGGGKPGSAAVTPDPSPLEKAAAPAVAPARAAAARKRTPPRSSLSLRELVGGKSGGGKAHLAARSRATAGAQRTRAPSTPVANPRVTRSFAARSKLAPNSRCPTTPTAVAGVAAPTAASAAVATAAAVTGVAAAAMAAVAVEAAGELPKPQAGEGAGQCELMSREGVRVGEECRRAQQVEWEQRAAEIARQAEASRREKEVRRKEQELQQRTQVRFRLFFGWSRIS